MGQSWDGAGVAGELGPGGVTEITSKRGFPGVADEADRPEVPEEILKLRRSIDNIDAAMVYLLAQRFQLTGQIGEIKAAVGLPSTDLAREKKQMKRLSRIADEAGLDVDFAQAFRAFVTAEVIRHHDHIAALARNDEKEEQ